MKNENGQLKIVENVTVNSFDFASKICCNLRPCLFLLNWQSCDLTSFDEM